MLHLVHGWHSAWMGRHSHLPYVYWVVLSSTQGHNKLPFWKIGKGLPTALHTTDCKGVRNKQVIVTVLNIVSCSMAYACGMLMQIPSGVMNYLEVVFKAPSWIYNPFWCMKKVKQIDASTSQHFRTLISIHHVKNSFFTCSNKHQNAKDIILYLIFVERHKGLPLKQWGWQDNQMGPE